MRSDDERPFATSRRSPIAALALAIALALPAASQIPPAERSALVAFFDATNGPSWSVSTGWLGAAGTECSWHGIACAGGRVASISLPSNHLSGHLPPELGSLTGLDYVWLSDNQIEGSIPREVGQLANLTYLALDHNALTGSIPAELGNLAKLENLYLNNNQLSGSIPPELGKLSKLLRLWMPFNRLGGSIPPELGGLSSLVDLWLSSNELDGPIPATFGALGNLERLWISSNRLDGSIPPELGAMPNLRRLWLESNQLGGAIPPELGSAPNLVYIRLHSNLLTGSIPPELAKLAGLQYLWLSSNRLTGSIPPELGSLASLERLWLDANELSGTIPASLGGLAKLDDLRLSLNKLERTIPPELGSLASLTRLALDRNQLAGSIPDELGALANLQHLALDRNRLAGAIPGDLSKLSRLEELSLDHNRLTGNIPSGLGTLPNLQYLAIDHNALSGAIPASIGGLAALQTLHLAANALTGTIPRELGALTNLQRLSLASNMLRGEIPAGVRQLSGLASDGLDLSYNALVAGDEATRAFVNAHHVDGDFEATQTVPPAAVEVASSTPTSITLRWTPVRFATFAGAYRIHVATSPEGPFALVSSTRDKFASGAVVPWLAPLTGYNVRVDTFTSPHGEQANTVVSDAGPVVDASTAPPEPEVVVTSMPGGMAVVADGVTTAETTMVVANLGTAPTSVALASAGSFFTLEPSFVELAPAASAGVTIRTLPVGTAGDYRGTITLSGAGVPAGLAVPVSLLGSTPPAGEPLIEVISARVDVAAPAGVNPSGNVSFRNAGSATAAGILRSSDAWIVPESSVHAIEPGAVRSFSFGIDRAKRPDADAPSGSQEGRLEFVYLSAATYAALSTAGRDPFSGAPSLAAPVTVSDTVRPGEKDFCHVAGCVNGVPALLPGEVGLVVAGIGKVTGSVGLFGSSIAISNRSGLPVDDLALFFAGLAVEQPISAGRWTSLADVASTAFGQSEIIGALHMRSRAALELAALAKVFVTDNPSGTFGSELPVFRTDRGAASGRTITITGMRQRETSHTNLYIQELQGHEARALIEFLDAGGANLPPSVDQTVPPFGMSIVGPARIPEGTVTARLTNIGEGGLAAFATPVDRTSNDTWAVADWGQVFGFAGSERQIVPVAGSAPGRNDTYFQTDLAIHARSAGSATVRYYRQTPSSSVVEKPLTLARGETALFENVVASLFAEPGPSLGSIEIVPGDGADLAVTSRTYTTVKGSPATFGTGVPALGEGTALRVGQSVVFGGLEDSTAKTTDAKTPASFRTNVGLVEVGGAPVRMKVSVLLFSGTQLAAQGETASKELDLAPREWRQLSAVVGTIVGREVREATYGELRNIQVRVEVVAGEGAVVAYVTETDNGTGDTLLWVN